MASGITRREYQIQVGGVLYDLNAPSTNFPGISNLIFAPQGMVQACRGVIQAKKVSDPEGMRYSASFFIGCLMAMSYAVSRMFALVNDYLKKTFVSKTVHQIVAKIGYGLCGLEVMLELWRCVNQLVFHCKIVSRWDCPTYRQGQSIDAFIRKSYAFAKKQGIENISWTEAPQVIAHNLRVQSATKALHQIKEAYFSGAEGDKASRGISLARRVQPWLFTKLQTHLGTVETLDDATKLQLFSDIKTQSQKALCIHLIALIGLGVTLFSIFASSLLLPPLLMSALILNACFVSLTASILQTCLLPSEGYQINWHFLLPECLRRKLGK